MLEETGKAETAQGLREDRAQFIRDDEAAGRAPGPHQAAAVLAGMNTDRARLPSAISSSTEEISDGSAQSSWISLPALGQFFCDLVFCHERWPFLALPQSKIRTPAALLRTLGTPRPGPPPAIGPAFAWRVGGKLIERHPRPCGTGFPTRCGCGWPCCRAPSG